MCLVVSHRRVPSKSVIPVLHRKRIINRHVKSLREWVEVVPASILQNRTEQAWEFAADPTAPNLVKLATRLSYIGRHMASTGLVQILDDDHHGWRLIHLGVAYLFSDFRISTTFALHEMPGPRESAILTTTLPVCANLACYARLTQHKAMERYCLQLLRLYNRSPEKLGRDWRERPFERYVLRLLDPEYQIDVGDPYAAVLDQTADSLVAACDYHIVQMKKVSNYMPEFEQPPFDLIACDVLVGASLLDLPVPDHPLLDLGFDPARQPTPMTYWLRSIERFKRSIEQGTGKSRRVGIDHQASPRRSGFA